MKLFVRRDHAGGRKLRNQDEITRDLRERGFVSMDPGKLEFREQVALFANAGLVVGVHGAALTNLLFAPRGIPFIELAKEPQPFFGELARHRGLRHLPLVGTAVGARDFEIDRDRLAALLENPRLTDPGD